MQTTLDHMSFAVTDIDAAIAFLSEFGFEIAFLERDMTRQIESMLGVPGMRCDLAQLALLDTSSKIEVIKFSSGSAACANMRPVAPGMGHLALKLSDFEAGLLKAQGLGAFVLGEITQFSEGRAAYLGTPFGLFLELQENRRD